MTAPDDPRCMVAFWMIGYEDAPEHSAEICVAEIFGRDVTPGGARVGMGVHPFGDPAITDDFAPVPLPIDVRVPHTYSAEWTPDQVVFYVDDEFVRAVAQSPAYPMQFMVGLYEFREPGGAPVGAYPKQCEVTQVRGYRRVG
jgi:beta-glucanase (GH16 family)